MRHHKPQKIRLDNMPPQLQRWLDDAIDSGKRIVISVQNGKIDWIRSTEAFNGGWASVTNGEIVLTNSVAEIQQWFRPRIVREEFHINYDAPNFK